MDDIKVHFKNESAEILCKLETIANQWEELFTHSPQLVMQLHKFLLKKHGICPSTVENKVMNADHFTQTDELQKAEASNDWNPENIANDVASVATRNLQENGLVYDETTGLYYDHNLQCYYYPDHKLYYHQKTGAYYYYDEESKSLKYYCIASSEMNCTSNNTPNAKDVSHEIMNEPVKPNSPPQACKNDNFGDSSEKTVKLCSNSPNNDFKAKEVRGKKELKDTSKDSEKEEGECSDSDTDVPSPNPIVIEAGPKTFEPDHEKHIAPCIRVLVKSSSLNELHAGTVFIVTCTGGTLGREGDHDILIPDKLVSKLHSSFRYVYRDGSYFYEITDMGSKNGTFLNGNRLSDTLIQSNAFEITHGSIITVGSTDLLCHIHPKDETCRECEGYSTIEDKKYDLTSELSLREKYVQESLAIRRKFGIINSFVPKYPAGYEDRSEIRRKNIGSSHSSEKTQVASVDVAIDKKNKGFALLTKMGWVEGSSLGKNDSGILEPINVDKNEGKHGLGCEEPAVNSQYTSKESKRMAIAIKTSERYQNIQPN